MFLANVMASSLSRRITHHRVLWRGRLHLNTCSFLTILSHTQHRERERTDRCFLRARVRTMRGRARALARRPRSYHSLSSLPASLPPSHLTCNKFSRIFYPPPSSSGHDRAGGAGKTRHDERGTGMLSKLTPQTNKQCGIGE